MEWPIIVILLISAVSKRGCDICPVPPQEPSSIGQEIVPGELYIMRCPDPNKGYALDAWGYLLQCFGENWRRITDFTYPAAYCTTEHVPCNGSPDPPPENTVSIDLIEAPQMRLYNCTEGHRWMSGAMVQLTQCIGGHWSHIFDICSNEESCPPPRDCSFLEEKGFTTSDSYKIFPNGEIRDQEVTVNCKFPGGWTTVMKNVPRVTAETSCKNEFGVPDDDGNYFIGTKTLQGFNKGGRPMVYQFVIRTADAGYHIAYDSVLLDNETNAITTLGNIHGTAGDAMSGAIGLNLQLINKICWWSPETHTEGHILFNPGSDTIWPGIEAPVSSMLLIVRPSSYDSAINCPAFLNASPAWIGHTDVTLYRSRDVGATITYKCVLPYMADGDQIVEDEVVCQDNLTWSRMPPLPCRLLPPPPQFFISDEATYYIHHSTSTAGSFLEAAQRCNELGASLANITYISNFQHGLDDTLYYTAYNVRSGEMASAIPANSTCDATDCVPVADSLPCVLFNKQGSHQAASCFGDHHYTCMIPAYCPEPYQEYKGSCFKVKESTVSSLLEAYEACIADGASLVRLNNYSSAPQFFADFIPDVNYFTGVHDLEAEGIYTVEESFKEALQFTSDKHWMYATVGPKVVFKSMSLEDAISAHPVCQYPGPTACLTDPKNIDGNWTYDWTEIYELRTTIVYTCDSGFFVGGDVNVTTQSVQCLGQLGEWYPPALDCIRVEVCTGDIPPGDEYMTIIQGTTTGYLDDSIEYICPDNMTTTSGLSSQTKTCIYIDDGVYGYDGLVANCTVCAAEPTVGNATTDWVGSTEHTVFSPLIATCEAHHLFSPNITERNFTCTRTGWEALPPCYEGCLSMPPTAGENMEATNATTFALGETIIYSCTAAGHYIQTPDGPATSLSVNCSSDHVWTPNDIVMDCVEVCMEDPLVPEAPIISSWDGAARAINTEIEFTCPANELFPNRSTVLWIRCGEDQIWTTIDPSILLCIPVLPLPLPLPPGTTYSVVGGETPYLVGQVVTFVCPTGEASKSGATSTNVTASPVLRWTPLDPTFECLKTCPDDPIIPPSGGGAISSWNGADKTVEVQINYNCPSNHLFPDKNETLTNECSNNGTWTFTAQEMLVCIEVVDVSAPSFGGLVVTVSGDDSPYLLGQVLTISCPENQYSLDGTNTTTITATADGWTPLDPNFSCNDLVGEDPPPAGYGLVMGTRGPPYVIGSEVNYTCIAGYEPVIDISFFTLEGIAGGWDPQYVPLTFFCIDKANVHPLALF